LLNATVWTGEKDGTEVVRNAAILLDNGIIKGIGHVARVLSKPLSQDLVIYDLHGSWVTPGFVDLYSDSWNAHP
jgi:cytosine/adenosine deaminase-related metal-dependent hydrolase